MNNTTHLFDAVIFDLDGVITKTALVHSTAWKKMFDEYLREREAEFGEPFREFSHEQDYLQYVDGKPRYKGVASFLESRGISLPEGTSGDAPGNRTICALGNRKNSAFSDVLEQDGVKAYESTVLLIKELIAAGIKIGVASSSKNCKLILEKAGLENLFLTRIDGVVSAELGLNGKPEPDIFTRAADNIGVTYDRTVIVEDAVSGVQAARKGNFGLVLGIARENNQHELKINGADIVMEDLSEIDIEGIDQWFTKGLEADNWSISYNDYVPEKEKSRESLLTIGNGYFGTRGAMEESTANPNNYPGTYMARLYNKLKSQIGTETVSNEDFVNCPNWLHTTFRINSGEWIDINDVDILHIQRKLDFRTGIVSREMTIRDRKNQETKIYSKRIAGMHNPHLAAMSYQVTPLNYSGTIHLKSGLKGDIINEGVERYNNLNQKHLEPIDQGGNGSHIHLLVQTTQSNIRIAQAAKFINNDHPCQIIKSDGCIYAEFHSELKENQHFAIEKVVSICTSKDHQIKDPLAAAKTNLEKAKGFDELTEQSTSEWEKIWQECDIQIEGDRSSQKLVRLHIYHIMVFASQHNKNIDAGIAARGLHGEAYRGHIFWDELYILPFYNTHFPDISRSVLMYRYNRLDKAREYAKEYGFKGAMFPWQSGSDGSEETQILHLNPQSGKWGDDYSSLQRHISIAVAYNIWQYYNTTLDIDFLAKYGAEVFFEICRFWASKSEKDETTGRYSIAAVMGPDEFHEKYPESTEGGIKNNAYTNLMVSWLFGKADEILTRIGRENSDQLFVKINLSQKELDHWQEIGSKLSLTISEDGIISQFDGYFDLEELDWDAYRKKYKNIHRLDRILKAEGKSPDNYKLAKQADTLMIFYTLDSQEVIRLMGKLGYSIPEDFIEKNLDYYIQRTSHGSTLSRVVHAKLAMLAANWNMSWNLYSDALSSDFNDVQGGTTAEGIHAGVMASTVLLAISEFAGVDLRQETLSVNPCLPEKWRGMRFMLTHRNVKYQFNISKSWIHIKLPDLKNDSIKINIQGKDQRITSKECVF